MQGKAEPIQFDRGKAGCYNKGKKAAACGNRRSLPDDLQIAEGGRSVSAERLFLYLKNEQQKQNHETDYVFHSPAPFRGNNLPLSCFCQYSIGRKNCQAIP